MNIMICCSEGLSSSIVVSKMIKYSEAQEWDNKIWATSIHKAKQNITSADVILLGPHMRAAGKLLGEQAAKFNIPSMTIDRQDYAYGNAKAIFQKINILLEEKKG